MINIMLSSVPAVSGDNWGEPMFRSFMFAALAVLLPSLAAAGTATVSWQEVTQRTDGTPVTISTYRIYFSPDAAPTKAGEFVTVTDALTYRFDGLPPATWYFAGTALDDDGLESALSAVVSKEITGTTTPPPESPEGLTVQEGALTAYTLVQSADRIVLVPVGTAPAGTPCEPTVVRDANGVVGYLIPRASVEWSGSVRPQVVVAQCGN